jgi:hypothetical protein
MDDPLSSVLLKTHVLDNLQVGFNLVVGEGLQATLETQVLADMIANRLVCGLTGYLQADHLCDASKDFSFAWPRSRWQRLKERHPGRFSRRFPVKYFRATATVDVKSWATFPQSQIVQPTLGKPLYIQQLSARSRAEPW